MLGKFLLVSFLLGLASCSGLGAPVDPEVRLRARVEGFLAARQQSDLAALRAFYLAPEMARTGNIRYLGSEIAALEVDESGRQARVKLRNTLQAMGFTFKDTPQTLDWVWEKGDWYLPAGGAAATGNPFAVEKPMPTGSLHEKPQP